MCVSWCSCVHRNAGAYSGQEGTADLLKLELYTVVSNLIQVLGTEFSFFAKALHSLNCWSISSAPKCICAIKTEVSSINSPNWKVYICPVWTGPSYVFYFTAYILHMNRELTMWFIVALHHIISFSFWGNYVQTNSQS